MAIELTIKIEDLGDGDVGVGVVTKEFRPADEPDHVGETWVGVCMAINRYMQTTCPGFDCLKGIKING